MTMDKLHEGLAARMADRRMMERQTFGLVERQSFGVMDNAQMRGLYAASPDFTPNSTP